jgi:hypothetical protein
MTIGRLEAFENIPDFMLWKQAALKQLDEFRALSSRLGLPIEVVSHHTSKSIRLPVIRISNFGGKEFYLRDDFRDVNLCVVSQEPMTLTVAQLMEGIMAPRGWDWYLNEVDRCRNYTWRGFSDEEMDDPRILRVQYTPRILRGQYTPPDTKRTLTSEVTSDQKDRWLKRMTDPEWWSRDWAGGTLHWNALHWDGDFGPGVQIYIQARPYMQGMEHLPSTPYRKDCTSFALALGDIHQAEKMIRKFLGPR